MSTDYRSMFDSPCIGAWDLNGKDVTVTVEKVEAGELVGQQGRKTKKPMVHFAGAKKPLALNKTNAKTIAAMYGNDTKNWIGKKLTLYPTTTDMAGQTVDCIRVRTKAPE